MQETSNVNETTLQSKCPTTVSDIEEMKNAEHFKIVSLIS